MHPFPRHAQAVCSFVILAIAIVTAGLCVGCCCLRKSDRTAIETAYVALRNHLQANDYQEAYALTAPAFQQSNSLAYFSEVFSFITNSSFRLHKNRELILKNDQAILIPGDCSTAEGELGPGVEFKKVNGRWYLSGRKVYTMD